MDFSFYSLPPTALPVLRRIWKSGLAQAVIVLEFRQPIDFHCLKADQEVGSMGVGGWGWRERRKENTMLSDISPF